VQLLADGNLGAGLDGRPLQGHVHEGRSHQKLKPNPTSKKFNQTKTHFFKNDGSGFILQDSYFRIIE
jgi:hypothetical protein